MTDKYKHAEAFNLMHYKDDVTGEIEILWNSRDGVTPFCIESRRGNSSVHMDWQKDVRYPDFKPWKGMRTFIDALPTDARIIEKATKYVEDFWEHEEYPMIEALHPKTKEEAIQFFIAEWTKPGSPTIREIE